MSTETKTKWAAEPWAIEADHETVGKYLYIVPVGDQPNSIAKMISGERNDADAARIVACVNACAPSGPVTIALRAVAECDLVALPSELRIAAREALRALNG